MKWYYSHGGQTQGPFSTAELKERAAAGSLLPDDLLWPEGADPQGAVAASDILDWAAPPPAPPPLPDWLDDVRATDRGEAPPGPAGNPALPDWLADVSRAEGVEPAAPAPPPKAAEEVAADILLSEPPGAAEAEPGWAPPPAETGPAPPADRPLGPPPPPTEPFDVALRRAMKEVHHWVDLEVNRYLVLRGDLAALRQDARLREIFWRYQGYGATMANKLWQYLEFLTDNRRQRGAGY
jgi:hypothetical protein